jgi:hypothetical protein
LRTLLTRFRNAHIFFLNLLHPDFLDRMAKENELIFMCGVMVWRMKSAVLSRELEILPAIRYELLMDRV